MKTQQIKRTVYLVSVVLFGLFGLPIANATLSDASTFGIHTNSSDTQAVAAANGAVFLPLILKPAPPTPTSTPTRTPTPTATPIGAINEWPMLAANPQRTSWTPEEVGGNLNVAWYRPIEPYIPYKIQPIAANGKIYVSTARGLYAFNATNGNLDWVYPTELPLGHSPTIATVNGRKVAFVGGYDHKIHAIDANTGLVMAGYTPYEAVAGFETNPLVINDSYTGNTPVIFAGNRDGYFYALDATTGALKWKFQTQGPILFSAAYKNGTIYFASNDSYAYALNVSNGTQIWRSAKLLGQGFHSFWPVLYTNKSTGKDYVSFTSGENYRNSEQQEPPASIESQALGTYNLPSGALPTTNPLISGDWASGTVTLNGSTLTNYFANHPQRRVVFMLDATTGQEFTYTDPTSGKPTYAPFGWSGIASAGTKYPGIVNGVDGVYYQQTAYVDYGGWTSRGATVGWKFGTQYLSKVAQGTNPETYASDEPTSFSSGGKMIYMVLCCDRAAQGFDITIPYGQANRAWGYWNYNLASNSLAPGYQQMYNDGDPPLYNQGNGWQIYSGKNQSKNGIYGKHGSNQSPPIPYQGKLYFLRGNALMAFSPTGTNPKTPLPLATMVSTQGTFTPTTAAELKQRLETAVQKMITAGHLRPGYHPVGSMDRFGVGHADPEEAFGEIFDYFQNPSDTVYTLLLAYPYLSANLQSQVKTYLQTNYGPGAPYDITKIVHIGWRNGADRTWSDIPSDTFYPTNPIGIGAPYSSYLDPSTRPICAGGDGTVCGSWKYFSPFNFYAAWKYAQIAGNNDVNTAKSIFNSMSSKIEAPLNTAYLTRKPYYINLYAAGYLGYLQLKQLAGLGGDATVQGYYNQMLSLRVNNFSKDTAYWPDSTWNTCCAGVGANYRRALSVAGNFMFLTPEIANYLNQNIKTQVQTAVNEYNYVAPYWFVSGFDNTIGEGTFQHLYDYPALFQAKAWILKQPYNELVKWLDVPAFKVGDLFYIQNLVATLSANP